MNDLSTIKFYGDFEVLNGLFMCSVLELINCCFSTHQVSFDLSVARGLDYYTGVIFEAVLTSLPPELAKAKPGIT